MRERIIELLTRKMAGEANQSELDELRDLISRYPDAVYYEEFLNQLWISTADQLDLEEQYQNHRQKFENEFTLGGSEKGYNRYEGFISVVCGLALVFIIGFLFFLDVNTKNTNALAEPTAAGLIVNKKLEGSPNTHITAGKGMRKKIELPDGTIVWLNSDSKLSYDTDMNKRNERSVVLVGEASFDVKHDKKRPFIVRTDKIAVKVLGTAFNVKAYPDDKKLVTTLLRGSIELSVNSRPEQKILLSPSEKFTLIENNSIAADQQGVLPTPSKDITLVLGTIDPVKIGNKEYIEETSWTENKLVFQNESFEELIPKLERWFNVKIQLNEASAIKTYRFTGVFTTENINQGLAAMQLIKSFNFKIKEHDVIIY